MSYTAKRQYHFLPHTLSLKFNPTFEVQNMGNITFQNASFWNALFPNTNEGYSCLWALSFFWKSRLSKMGSMKIFWILNQKWQLLKKWTNENFFCFQMRRRVTVASGQCPFLKSRLSKMGSMKIFWILSQKWQLLKKWTNIHFVSKWEWGLQLPLGIVLFL